MKNINLWRQADFSKGENTNEAPHLIGDSQSSRLINLVPGNSNEPLRLRGGFQPWSMFNTSGSPISVDGSVIGLHGFKGHVDVSGSVYQADGILTFSKSDSYPTVNVNSVFGMDNISLPTASGIPSEQLWTTSGSVVISPVGIVTQQPTYAFSFLSGASLSNGCVPKPKEYAEWGLSYWASVTNGENYGNNYDTWGSEDGVSAVSAWQYPGYWNSFMWADHGTETYFGDVWYGHRETSPDLVDPNYNFVVLDSARMVLIKGVNYFTEVAIPNSNLKEPSVLSPEINITIDGPNGRSGVPIRFKFAYEAARYGIAVRIYHRKKGSSAWTESTLKSGLSVPLRLIPQTEIPTESERYPTQSGPLAGQTTVVFSENLPYGSTEYKIVICPCDITGYDSWWEVDGTANMDAYFVGVEIGGS